MTRVSGERPGIMRLSLSLARNTPCTRRPTKAHTGVAAPRPSLPGGQGPTCSLCTSPADSVAGPGGPESCDLSIRVTNDSEMQEDTWTSPSSDPGARKPRAGLDGTGTVVSTECQNDEPWGQARPLSRLGFGRRPENLKPWETATAPHTRLRGVRDRARVAECCCSPSNGCRRPRGRLRPHLPRSPGASPCGRRARPGDAAVPTHAGFTFSFVLLGAAGIRTSSHSKHDYLRGIRRC